MRVSSWIKIYLILWSTTYNIDIEASNNTFPFGGYDIVKAVIDDLVIEKHNTTVLDLGIGTGIISSILYDKGANIYGVDFSEEMLNQCKTAMNDAVLINCDLSKGLADLELPKFSYVLSTYVFHHFDDTVKMNLIKDALAHLNETGTFILSDICFPNCCDLEQFKSSNP